MWSVALKCKLTYCGGFESKTAKHPIYRPFKVALDTDSFLHLFLVHAAWLSEMPVMTVSFESCFAKPKPTSALSTIDDYLSHLVSDRVGMITAWAWRWASYR